MARKDMTVEDRIVEKYSGGDGNWVIEKGKVAECKLLKDAVGRINELKKEIRRLRGVMDTMQYDERKVRLREERLDKREKEINNRIDSVIRSIEYAQEEAEASVSSLSAMKESQ